jgi:hypothetical protein
MLDVTDEAPTKPVSQEKAATSATEEPTSKAAEVSESVANPPLDEPSPAKKAKTSESETPEEDDWVEIDKDSIPKRVTVEDVEDEEDKPKF